MKTYKIALVLAILAVASGMAQNEEPYVIGVDDVLTITFWQEPDLNSDVRVRNDGMITLPVVGDIKAAGLTTSQLSQNIVNQISFYNPGISQATVVVTEYNSKVVVISGAVNVPGEYHFEEIPNILDVIRKAGGVLPEADLSNVTVIRQGDDKADIINVDVLKYIKDGDLSKMPRLEAKDMINVPLSPYGATTGSIATQTFKGRSIYFIYGAVGEPGVKNLAEDIELADAIAAAGGITAEADLKNVRVITKDIRYSTVLKFNHKEYNETGRPYRYALKPEDTIYIPYHSGSSFLAGIPELLIPAIATTIVTTVIRSALSGDDTPATPAEEGP